MIIFCSNQFKLADNNDSDEVHRAATPLQLWIVLGFLPVLDKNEEEEEEDNDDEEEDYMKLGSC